MRRFLDRLYLGAAYAAACCLFLIMVLMIGQSILRQLHLRTGAVNDVVAWLCAAPRSFSRFYLKAFATFLAQPHIVVALGFILLYRAGDALLFAMSTPLLDSLGVPLGTRGFISGTIGTTAGIAGSIVGGVVIGRLGLRRTLTPVALLQSLALLIYVALAVHRPALPAIVAAVVVEQFIAGVGSAAFVVFLMRRCFGEYKASHFAIATALMSVATTAFGTMSGPVAGALGFPAYFALAYVVSIPGVLLSMFVPKD